MKKEKRFTMDYIHERMAAGSILSYKENNTVGVDLSNAIHKSEKEEKEDKKSKYNNKKKIVDDIQFHSIKEAGRYGELKMMLKAGVIGLLQLQMPFELNPGGSHSLKYIADFVYLMADTGEMVVEDVKGKRTQEYIHKRRLMKKVHGIIIKEI